MNNEANNSAFQHVLHTQLWNQTERFFNGQSNTVFFRQILLERNLRGLPLHLCRAVNNLTVNNLIDFHRAFYPHILKCLAYSLEKRKSFVCKYHEYGDPGVTDLNEKTLKTADKEFSNKESSNTNNSNNNFHQKIKKFNSCNAPNEIKVLNKTPTQNQKQDTDFSQNLLETLHWLLLNTEQDGTVKHHEEKSCFNKEIQFEEIKLFVKTLAPLCFKLNIHSDLAGSPLLEEGRLKIWIRLQHFHIPEIHNFSAKISRVEKSKNHKNGGSDSFFGGGHKQIDNLATFNSFVSGKNRNRDSAGFTKRLSSNFNILTINSLMSAKKAWQSKIGSKNLLSNVNFNSKANLNVRANLNCKNSRRGSLGNIVDGMKRSQTAYQLTFAGRTRYVSSTSSEDLSSSDSEHLSEYKDNFSNSEYFPKKFGKNLEGIQRQKNFENSDSGNNQDSSTSSDSGCSFTKNNCAKATFFDMAVIDCILDKCGDLTLLAWLLNFLKNRVGYLSCNQSEHKLRKKLADELLLYETGSNENLFKKNKAKIKKITKSNRADKKMGDLISMIKNRENRNNLSNTPRYLTAKRAYHAENGFRENKPGSNSGSNCEREEEKRS